MKAGLKIRVVELDDDYLGIEIRAWNDRHAGTTFIYAGLNDLSECAARIAGFPAHNRDERKYEFGSLNPSFAGGHSILWFRTTDGVGHASLDIGVADGGPRYSEASAKFAFPVEATSIDRFAQRLRDVE